MSRLTKGIVPPAQRRPLPLHALPLDLAHLPLGKAELLAGREDDTSRKMRVSEKSLSKLDRNSRLAYVEGNPHPSPGVQAPRGLPMGTPPTPPLDAPCSQALLRPTVQKALAILIEGYDFALDLETCVWEFAVPIRNLLEADCSVNTLRWLVRRGFAEYAVLTGAGTPGAHPNTGGKIEFADETSFVLTEVGVAAALAAYPSLPFTSRARLLPGGQHSGESAVPAWDERLGELRYLGVLVKRLRKAASNQWALLSAFEREGWPGQLGNPLPQLTQGGVKQKQRLHDAIKNLNRDHEVLLLRFYGAGSGRGVGWRTLV
jgi:hypothetical protein